MAECHFRRSTRLILTELSGFVLSCRQFSTLRQHHAIENTRNSFLTVISFDSCHATGSNKVFPMKFLGRSKCSFATTSSTCCIQLNSILPRRMQPTTSVECLKRNNICAIGLRSHSARVGTFCQVKYLTRTRYDGDFQFGRIQNIASSTTTDIHPSIVENVPSSGTGGKRFINPVMKKSSKVSAAVAAAAKKTEDKSNILVSLDRAVSEYCLSAKEMVGLPAQVRRSAYVGKAKEVMYLITDVEERAIAVHGSVDALEKAQSIRRRYVANVPSHHTYRTPLREPPVLMHGGTKRDSGSSVKSGPSAIREAMTTGSGKVVLYAISINSANCVAKLAAWFYTGSSSMFAEAVHSFADTLNQIILAIGIQQSVKKPDSDHPYGYANIRYVSCLISGVGIFFFGTGLSLYHGVSCLMAPHDLEPLFWAFAALGGSFLSEGVTLVMAIKETRRKASLHGKTFFQYVWSSDDPSLNVVLLEDCAAVLGVSVAASALGMSYLYGNVVFDAIGSLGIGGILGIVASFIIYTNSAHLVGKSIPIEEKQQVIEDLEKDVMIRSIQDVKATEMGSDQVRFKAEIDFDGRQVTRSYLGNQNLTLLLEEMRGFQTPNEIESFLLKHGEGIIDQLGEEVDRIERELKAKHPEYRHVDLEVL